MMLTTKTRFGTTAVFDVAYNTSGLPIHVREVAQRQEIPIKYLEQIFHKLKKADFIKSERGPSGGYTLTKDPSEITVRDIVSAVEESLDLVYCIGSDNGKGNGCHRVKQCVTRPVWQEASKRINDYFDSVTISDLCENAEKIGVRRHSSHPFDYFI